MSGRQSAFLDHTLYLAGQPQKPERSRYYRTLFANLFRNHFLRKSNLINEFSVRLGFLNRIQFLPLNILDQRELKQFFVGNFPDKSRYAAKFRTLCRTPAPLARNDLVTASCLTDDDWLNDAIRTDRLRQLFKIALGKPGSRLLRIWLDQVDVDLERPGFCLKRLFLAQQCSKASSKRLSSHCLISPLQVVHSSQRRAIADRKALWVSQSSAPRPDERF